MRLLAAAIGGALSLLSLPLGCGKGSDGLACVEGLPAQCSPLYAPTFDNLFTRTLQPTCAQSGASCHSSQGMMGGLVFEDENAAYNLLLGKTDGKARVNPGDPSCSLIVEHLESTDPGQVMPPGAPLSDQEKCVFIQWIAMGAAR